MKPYTVLLMYPDYLANQYGEDTFLDHVYANDPAHAVLLSQTGIWEQEFSDHGGQAEDFACLLVIEGHHFDVKP